MLLSLVANSLSQSSELHVVQVSAWDEVASLLPSYNPDVLIYELEGVSESPILPLWFRNPRLRLIGLDLETNRAVLIAGKETCELTLGRVKEIVFNN